MRRVRLRQARRRSCDVMAQAGPSKLNNQFFAPFITGTPAGHIKAVEIRSGHTLHVTQLNVTAACPERNNTRTVNIPFEIGNRAFYLKNNVLYLSL